MNNITSPTSDDFDALFLNSENPPSEAFADSVGSVGSSELSFKIKLAFADDQVFVMQVEPDDFIKDLKQMIRGRFNIHVNKQILTFEGTLLEDDEAILNDYGIVADSTIVVKMHLVGGGVKRKYTVKASDLHALESDPQGIKDLFAVTTFNLSSFIGSLTKEQLEDLLKEMTAKKGIDNHSILIVSRIPTLASFKAISSFQEKTLSF